MLCDQEQAPGGSQFLLFRLRCGLRMNSLAGDCLEGYFSFSDEEPRLVGNITRLFSAPLSAARETGRKRETEKPQDAPFIRGTFPKIEAFHSFFTRRQQLLMLHETVNPAWSSRRDPVSAPGCSCSFSQALCPPKSAWDVGNEQLEAELPSQQRFLHPSGR